jgi:hypothetical protein
MKRHIREKLKDNTLRKTVVSLPALSSTVLQDRLLDVDLSTKRWRNGTVSIRSQVSQNGGGYWNIPDDLRGSKYRKSNLTVSGKGSNEHVMYRKSNWTVFREREVMNTQLILGILHK